MQTKNTANTIHSDPSILLDDWTLFASDPGILQEADPTKLELGQFRLMGRVYGHPKIEDGQIVLTSALLGAESKIVFTHNTSYKLGKPSDKHIDWIFGSRRSHNIETPLSFKNQ